jgi:hypothetical protein
MINSVRYDENDSFELGADDLTAYGASRLLSCFVAETWSRKTGLRMALWVEPRNSAYSLAGG